MDFRSRRGGRHGLAGSRPYSNLGMPFRSNDFPSGSISGDALYNRSRFNSDLSLSESGDTSEESEAGDYAPEKKKKKMTVKSKREKRITPRRMLRSATERQNLARSARNDRAGSSDFSIVRRHQKLSENHILGSNQAAQSGFSFGSAATFAMPAGGFVLEDSKSEEESSESYLISEYDGLPQEHDITYSPTDPNYQAKNEEESSESYLISEYDGLPQEHAITYSPTDPNHQGTGFELPQAAVKVLQLTAQAQSSPMSRKPSVSVATKCFMLSNMFDPVKETNPTWDEDIKNDVIKECRNHGGALHVHVDKNSPDGNVYVKCPSLTAAAAMVRVLHGRYFAGRVINVTYVPEANYQMLFPDSAAAVAVL